MQGNESAELRRADLPLPADNAHRQTAQTDNRPRAGHVTATTTPARKLLGAWLSPENRNATGLDSVAEDRRPLMSAPTLSFGTAQARRSRKGYLRLRLKPAERSDGPVQGAWWPRSDQLFTELPPLLAALTPLLGSVDRVIYDENNWAPQSLRMEFKGRSIILEGSSTTSPNTLSVIGKGFGRLVLLIVPPYTNPTRAYTAVVTASKPDDVSSPDELLGIGRREAQGRRRALMAHQRWEPKGGALRRRGHERGDGAVAAEVLEVRHAQ
jgi:hypothetical protein